MASARDDSDYYVVDLERRTTRRVRASPPKAHCRTFQELEQEVAQRPEVQALDDTALIYCPCCNGTGSVTTRMQSVKSDGTKKESSSLDMPCVECVGETKVTKDAYIGWVVDRELLCRCDVENRGDPVFFADATHTGCYVKPHYHCSNCGLVSQIG